jgi:predicted dehydrogenase
LNHKKIFTLDQKTNNLKNMNYQRKLRMGMIGGGIGSFIGSVHRSAAQMDGEIELVCGVFDTDPEVNTKSGLQYFLDPGRIYPSYVEMIDKEQELPEDLRMDFVCIVTPNHLHFEPAKLALEAGFHVVCEKPVTMNLDEAMELTDIIYRTGLQFAITHPYTSYPMVKEAREFVQSGKLGAIRKVIIEYSQGWLSTFLESTGNRQASWRTDPKKAGKAGSIGDIGTHAFNLAEFVTGLQVDSLCADLTTFVEGRQLEDDANILLRFENGAKGILIASQVSAGEENRINLRVYGELGSIDWSQMEPNSMIIRWLDKPMQVLRAGDANNLGRNALFNTRLPMGHPEGLIEAFANIYRNFALTLRFPQMAHSFDFPTIGEGVRTMQFIDAVIDSNVSEQKWVEFEKE